MMKTSAPRMFSSIWNETSLSGNRRRRACPSVNAEEVGNLPRQVRVGAAGEDLQLAEPGRHQAFTAERSSHRCARSRPQRQLLLVGAEGFEPSNTGSKVPRLTAWPRPSTVVDMTAIPRSRRPGWRKRIV